MGRTHNWAGRWHSTLDKLGYSRKYALAITILQVVTGAVVFISSFDALKNYRKLFQVPAIVLFSLVLLLLLVRWLSFFRSSAIVFQLHKDSGVLTDRIAGFRNVALRRATWITLTSSLYDKLKNSASPQIAKEGLFQAGVSVGINFADDLNEYWSTTHRSNNAPRTAIDLWLNYDSSSGMGKFEIEPGSWSESPKVSFVVLVRNPFTYSKDVPDLSELLRGYIQGAANHILNRPCEAKFLDIGSVETGSLNRFEVKCM